jgi:hypothetical protein
MMFKPFRAVQLSRRLVNAVSEETRVRSWANPCEICGGQCDSGTGFLRVICRLCQNGKRAHPGNASDKILCRKSVTCYQFFQASGGYMRARCTVCFIDRPPVPNFEVLKNTENVLLHSKEKWEKYPVPVSNMSRSLHALSTVSKEYVLNLIVLTETTSCFLYLSLCDVTTRFTNGLS